MTVASHSKAAKLSIDGVRMEFLSIRGGARTTLIDRNNKANRGTYENCDDNVAAGLVYVEMQVAMHPSAVDLDTLLPLIGLSESPTDTFTIGDFVTAGQLLPEFTVVVDRVAKVHTYTNCVISSAVFSCQKGSTPLTLNLNIVGVTETEGNAGTFPALSLTCGPPMAMNQLTLTTRSASRQADRIAIGIDHKVQREFNNSTTATHLTPTDRQITLSCSMPYIAANTDMYTQPGPTVRDIAGDTGTAVFTNGGLSTSFQFANLKELAQSPDVLQAQEIRLPVNMLAYGTDATKSLIVVNDATA
jgi:hypothetical protein